LQCFFTLFLALFIPLFVIVFLVTIFFVTSCALEIGSEDELTFQNRNNLLFFEQLGALFSTLHEQVVLVGGEKNEFFMGDGSHSVGVLIRLICDVQAKRRIGPLSRQ
jgi:hypothetical protein